MPVVVASTVKRTESVAAAKRSAANRVGVTQTAVHVAVGVGNGVFVGKGVLVGAGVLVAVAGGDVTVGVSVALSVSVRVSVTVGDRAVLVGAAS